MEEKPQESTDFKPKLPYKNYSSPVNKIIIDAAIDALPRSIKNNIKELGEMLLLFAACRCEEDSCPNSRILNDLVETINKLIKEFDTSIGHRAYAVFELIMHKILMMILRKNSEDIVVTYPCLEALISISKDIPEVLDSDTMFLILFYLQYQTIAATRQQIFKWIYALTINDEENRRYSFEQVLPPLLDILSDDTSTAPIVENIALVIQALVTYDDDPWIYKEACDRIKAIGKISLDPLLCMVNKFLQSTAVLKILLVTIQKILVEKEMIDVLILADDNQGLLYIADVFAYHFAKEEMVLEGLKVFAILVDNEKVLHLMDKELLHILKAVLRYYPTEENITETTLSIIAKVLLKYSYCSKWYYLYYIPELVVRTMIWHPQNAQIQRKASWIIRIFIKDCRCSPLFKRLGVPEFLYKAWELHSETAKYDVMAALRDMGYKIDLSEPMQERSERSKVPY